MPNTKVTRQKWKDHLYYSKKFYFIGILVSLAVASLIFSVTRYVPENEHAVHIELVDTYADTTKLDSDAAVLLQRGIEFDSSLERSFSSPSPTQATAHRTTRAARYIPFRSMRATTISSSRTSCSHRT